MTTTNGSTQPEPRRYAWRWGSFHIPPALAAAELERINDQHGGLTPKDVVDEARPDDAPLHPAFTWDDTDAGEKWREYEARHLIRSVRVVRDHRTEPLFVNVVRVAPANNQPRRVYRPLREVVRNIPDLQSAISVLAGKLEAARQSLEELKDAAAEASMGDTEMGILIAIGEALSTARELAIHLS